MLATARPSCSLLYLILYFMPCQAAAAGVLNEYAIRTTQLLGKELSTRRVSDGRHILPLAIGADSDI